MADDEREGDDGWDRYADEVQQAMATVQELTTLRDAGMISADEYFQRRTALLGRA